MLADTATLATLPPEELAAGFVEVLKTGLLAGGDLWERVRQIEALDPDELDDIVFACARYKCAVVAADERDAGLRARPQPRPHGRPRDRGGQRLLALPPRRGDRPRPAGGAAALRRRRTCATRSRRSSPATACRSRLDPAIDVDAVLDALQRDKKRTAAGVGFVLLSEPGKPRTGQIVDPAKVREAVEELYSMNSANNRVAVLHGVNFDVLERRDASIYGGLSLSQLEAKISDWAHELGLEPIFFQTNSEGEFCEYLHRSVEMADAVIVNAGAWTHYSRAIADALELTRLPAVEVHLSDVEARDDWRRLSVFDGLVLAKVSGKGPDGYREALELLAARAGHSA